MFRTWTKQKMSDTFEKSTISTQRNTALLKQKSENIRNHIFHQIIVSLILDFKNKAAAADTLLLRKWKLECSRLEIVRCQMLVSSVLWEFPRLPVWINFLQLIFSQNFFIIAKVSRRISLETRSKNKASNWFSMIKCYILSCKSSGSLTR